MNWLWDMIGGSIIIGAVFSKFLELTGNLAHIQFWVPPIGNFMASVASNLSMAIPIGLFLIFFKPNPRSMVYSIIIAGIAGVALWLAGF